MVCLVPRNTCDIVYIDIEENMMLNELKTTRKIK